MATAGGANVWVVSMQSGQGGALACRHSSSCALLLHRAPSGLSSSSARVVSILSSPRSRTPVNVRAIHAQDPDFYKIPYVEGIPVGKRLKLWNLPPNCKHSELLEWFAGIDVKVGSLEFTDDPVLNAHGIGGFVEFATKQHACIAILRLDGYKFRGHHIRMDFAEKRPHSRDYGSLRNRPNQSSSSSSRGSFATSSRSDMVRSYDGKTSANAQLTPRYEAANSSTVQASSGFGSSSLFANAQLSPSHEAENSSAVQASSDYGSNTQPSEIYRNSATQAAPRAYDGTKISPIGTVSNDGRASLQSPVAQGPPPRPLNSSHGKVEPYEDPFKNYGVPDAALVEPWLQNTSFRSGPMFGSPQPSSLNRLFVSSLAVSIDDATLHELFSKFGTVLEARVLRDQESGRSRGFAVVAMSTVNETNAASKALDGWRVESHPLKVEAVTFKH